MTDQFKKMSFKKKSEYIWDYYRFYILGSILAVIIFSSIFYSVFLNPLKELYSGISFYGDFVNDSSLSALNNKITHDLVKNDTHEIRFSCFYEMPDDPAIALVLEQKFSAMIIGKEIDLIIADKDYFHYLTDTGYIISLEEIMDSAKLNEFKNSEELYYDSNQEDSTQRIYGIKLENSTLLKTINYPAKERYVGVVRNGIRIDNALETLNYLIK